MTLVKPLLGTPLLTHHPLAYGLVGCWLFNEGAGLIAADSSGNGNHGTLTNMANPGTPTSGWTSGPNGGALAFDQHDDTVNCGNPAALQIGMGSVFAAVKDSVSDTSFHGISVKQNAYGMFVSNHNFRVYSWGVHGTGKDTGISLNDGSWHRVGFTFYSAFESVSQCYIDGKPVGTPFVVEVVSQTTGLSISGGTNPIVVDSQIWGGLISDVMIWNRALSAEEVAYLYAQPYCMFDPDFHSIGIPIVGHRWR